MERVKKVGIVVVLLLIIVATAGMVLRTVLGNGGPTPPGDIMDLEVEKIDQSTLMLMTKTLGEWENLGERNGKYKNPETKEYTMMTPIICRACGEKIPAPEFPEIARSKAAKKRGPEGDRIAAIVNEITRNYTCPRCGASPF